MKFRFIINEYFLKKDEICQIIKDFLYDTIENVDLVDNKLIEKFDLFLKEEIKIPYSTLDVIKIAIDNMTIYKLNTLYEVSLNNIDLLTNTKFKLDAIICLIEYGNLSIKGLNIMEKLFKYVENNINTLLDTYYEMVGD